MSADDPKTFLWSNICILMQDENPPIDAVQRKTKVGRGTIQRIKEGATSIGIDKLHEIADAFNLPVWQLLVPGLGVAQPKSDISRLEDRAVTSSAPDALRSSVINIGNSLKSASQLTRKQISPIFEALIESPEQAESLAEFLIKTLKNDDFLI